MLRGIPRGDSVELVVDLFEVGRKTALKQARVGLATGVSDVRPYMARLVERLFGIPAGALSPRGSEVDEAVKAYVAGRMALESWNLRLAGERFQQAIEQDPAYTLAHLWLAQVKSWAGDRAAAWVGSAGRRRSSRCASSPPART